MRPYYSDDAVTLYHGDCLDVLRALPDASVDSVVTDPPYNLSFMAKPWDAYAGRMDGTLAGGSKAAGETTLGRWPANLILTYPEEQYMLRDDVTPDQLHKLAEWMNENAKH